MTVFTANLPPFVQVWLPLQEKAGQLRERSALTAERDALSSKLVRRGEEVALLTAKLRLQTSELQV